MSPTQVKILWLSSNRFGHALLREAIGLSGISVQAVITLAEDASTKMYDAVPRDAWDAFGVPVVAIRRIEEQAEVIRASAAELMVVAGWRQRLPPEILSLPPRGVIGFHPTLLPVGRGPAPIINSILEGFTHSGVTMFYLCEALDAGDVVGQEPFTIEARDDAGDVYEKVVNAGRNLVRRFLPRIATGTAPRLPQDESKATYFQPRSPKDNEILADDPPELQHRKVRAFAKPYLGAYRTAADGARHVVWRVEELDRT